MNYPVTLISIKNKTKVLFTTNATGTVVDVGDSKIYDVGHFSDSWWMPGFTSLPTYSLEKLQKLSEDAEERA